MGGTTLQAWLKARWERAYTWAERLAPHLDLPPPPGTIVVAMAVAVLIGAVLALLVAGLMVRVSVEIAGCVFGPCGPAEPSRAFTLLQTLLLGIGGGLTLYYLAKRSKALEKTAQANVEALEKRTEELRMTRRDHLSKRFSESVKQLGDDKLAIRLGGIAGLRAVAEESEVAEDEASYATEADKKRAEADRQRAEADKRMVLDVLCAFVRTKSRENFFQINEISSDYSAKVGKALEDIQAAMNVVFKISLPSHLYDFSGAVLNEANLHQAKLSGANLIGVHLKKGFLVGADLTEAILMEACLSGADLSGAKLREGDLSNADLCGVDLSGADLRGADLREADLSGADLSECDLSGADLEGADMRRVDLNGATLIKADLVGVDLTGADLSEADLREADLGGAILQETDLSDAKVMVDQLGAARSLEGARGVPHRH